MRTALRFLLLMLVLAGGVGSAEPWPQFRGDAQHTGGAGYGAPSLLLHWSASVGDANDGLAAAASVYSTDANGKVYAVNGTTGQRAWAVDTHESSGGGVAADDAKVYVGTSGAVYAIKSDTGAIVWETAVNGTRRSTPAVSGDVVYVGSIDGVYALGTDGGKVLWRSEIPGGGVLDSSPCLANNTLFVQSNSGRAIAIDAATGRVVWSRQVWTGQVSPASQDGVVYVAGADPQGKHPALYALNGSTGEVRWMAGASSRIADSVLAGPDGIYFGEENGVFHKLDFSGHEVWNYSGPASGPFAPAISGMDVYLAYAPWQVSFPGSGAGGSMVPSSGRFGLFVLDARSGAVVASFVDRTLGFHAPILMGNRLFAVGGDKLLYAFGDGSGRGDQLGDGGRPPDSNLVSNPRPAPSAGSTWVLGALCMGLFWARKTSG